jgi:hypothetical protein
VIVVRREKSIRSGWRCDSCGELVSDLHAGWVEWVASDDGKRRPKVRGLRLVHRGSTSLRGRKPYSCQYDSREEFKKSRGIVEGLPLDRFTGPDGLMLLLSMIAERELPVEQLIELTKRVQIPGYEAVYELVHDAVDEGVVAPAVGLGFYLQSEIGEVLNWAKYRTSLKSAEHQHHCVISH